MGNKLIMPKHMREAASLGLDKAVTDWFSSPIDTRGTPYRHCKGCDDAGVVPKHKERPHTCKLCQRCLADDHDHTTCTNPIK